MLKVTCAIIEHEGKILICQRSERMAMPLKWEFPGGKMEAGETEEQCLTREIREELGLEIAPCERLTPVNHQYPTVAITLYPHRCRLLGGTLHLSEHQALAWVELGELPNYDWAEADKPIVQELMMR